MARYTSGLLHPWILAAAAVPVLALFARTWLTPLLPVLAVAVFLFTRSKGGKPVLPATFGLLVAAIVAWGAASALWAIDPSLSLQRAAKLGAIAAFGVVLVGAAGPLTAGERRQVALTLSVATVAAFVAGTIGLFVAGVLVLDLAGAALKLTAAVSIPLKRGAMILAVLPWVAAAGLVSLGRHRLAMSCLLLPPVLLLPLSAETALIAWGAGLAAAAAGLFIPRKGLIAAVWIVPVVMAATPLLAKLIPTDLSPVAGSLPSPALHRLVAWRFTADRIAERPLLGWGLENARVLPGGDATAPIARFIENRPPDGKDLSAVVEFLAAHPPKTLPLHPHNFVLQCWAELGLPGTILAAAAIMVLLSGALRLARTRWQLAVNLGLFTTAGAMAYLSFGAWQSWWHAALWIVAAFVIALLRPSDESHARS